MMRERKVEEKGGRCKGGLGVVAFDRQTAHSRRFLALVMTKVHVPYVTTLVRLDSGPTLESLPDRMSVYNERTGSQTHGSPDNRASLTCFPTAFLLSTASVDVSNTCVSMPISLLGGHPRHPAAEA